VIKIDTDDASYLIISPGDLDPDAPGRIRKARREAGDSGVNCRGMLGPLMGPIGAQVDGVGPRKSGVSRPADFSRVRGKAGTLGNATGKDGQGERPNREGPGLSVFKCFGRV
jgi:hypothetical protein